MTEYLDLIYELIKKHLSGETLSGEEQATLEAWINKSPHNAAVLNHFEDDKWLAENLFYLENVDTEKIWRKQKLLLQGEMTLPSSRKMWLRIAAAVFGVILITGMGVYFSKRSQPVSANVVSKSGTVLTLADGTRHYLNDIDTGVLTEEDNVRIIKHGNNRLSYEVSGKARPIGVAHQVYNTLTVQKGQQYQLLLPDSTKVWLNSASSLRYPAIFPDKSREVELTGEAYFEVTKNPKAPFKIKVRDQEITVLGTSFNVRGYAGELSVKTTLKDGTVTVSRGDSTVTLYPGQQAVADSGTAKIQVQVLKVKDVEGVISWKDGYFHFDDMDIPTAMRELGRYYDKDIINIIIRPGIASGPLATGTFERSVALKDLLKSFEREHLHFRIEEKTKTIFVEP